MIHSMTGFATLRGAAAGFDWAWEIRSVNGRGLDLRIRVPDWIDGLEPEIRSRVSKSLHRGNVTVSLKVSHAVGGQESAVDEVRVKETLASISRVQRLAQDAGLKLRKPSAVEILMMRTGGGPDSADEDSVSSLRSDLLAAFETLRTDFIAMRAEEGRALERILSGQIDAVAARIGDAKAAADARPERSGAQLKEAVARLTETVEIDEGRLSQELALLAVKADVTEELDRLRAHVDAARGLLGTTGAVGRKLDFLVQEFNREANTLCSKAQSTELTAIGLELKAVIDQMREQAANVE